MTESAMLRISCATYTHVRVRVRKARAVQARKCEMGKVVRQFEWRVTRQFWIWQILPKTKRFTRVYTGVDVYRQPVVHPSNRNVLTVYRAFANAR